MVITKNSLVKKYIIQRKTLRKIGLEIGLSHVSVIKLMKIYNIPRRNHSESQIGKRFTKKTKKKMSLAKKGKISTFKNKYHTKETKLKIQKIKKELFKNPENHPMWKGGITSLNKRIRGLEENKSWRIQIFKRDNYTCQECSQIGGNLEAHHEIPFIRILREFLKYYNQFSPIEDKETLVRLAIKWKPFWDISNGKTLCEDCHRNTKRTKYIK